MTDPTPRRRFDDDEVALILRRATEMQASAASPGEVGMTLADLEEIAREAGLDPALVRRAAAEVQSGAAQPPLHGGSRFLGAPTRLRHERIVDGELAAEDYEAVVEEIRRTFGDVGMVSVLGRTLSWRTTPSMQRHGRRGRDVSVTIATRGGKTGIRVEETTTNVAGGLFGGLMGGLGGGGGGAAIGIGMGTMHSVAAGFGLWGALIGGSYLLARTIYGSISRSRAAELATLADRLVAIIEATVRPG